MIPKLVIPCDVYSRLLSGADVMIPGLQAGSQLHGLQLGNTVAIHGIGNDRAIAVGVMIMDASAISASNGKGKCTKTYHVYGDWLWKYGDKSVPNDGFREGSVVAWSPPVQSATDENATDEIFIEDLHIEEQDFDTKLAIENAVLDYLQSANLPVFISDAAAIIAAKDERFDIRSTPYRTWDMLFRSFAKRGAIKIKDASIVKTNALKISISKKSEDDVMDDDEPSPEEMDVMLESALISALKFRIADFDLPLSASVLTEHMMASTRNKLNVKASSHKTSTKLFRAFAKRDLIKVKEHKNVLSLVGINRDVEELRVDPEEKPTVVAAAKKKTKDLSKITVATRFEPNKHVRFLFGSAPSKQLYSMDDARARLRDYIVKEELRLDQGFVRLNPVIAGALFHGTAVVPDTISSRDLFDRFDKQFVLYTAISKPGEKMQFKKGGAPSIEIIVERVGQKTRTRVKNLECFGIDPAEVAHQSQKLLACATSVKALPGKAKPTLYEVLIQGKMDKEMISYLHKDMSIPQHLFTVVRKDIKS